MNSSFIQEKQPSFISKIIPGNTDFLNNFFGNSNETQKTQETQKYNVLIKPELKRSTNQYMVLNDSFVFPDLDSDSESDNVNPNDKKKEPKKQTEEPKKQTDKPKKDNDNNKKMTLNYTTKFYIGSITIVGLFILFRMIQKTR